MIFAFLFIFLFGFIAGIFAVLLWAKLADARTYAMRPVPPTQTSRKLSKMRVRARVNQQIEEAVREEWD